MSNAKVQKILVVGATGNQGTAVIDALLAADEGYELIGLTRDANSEASKALEERGVEMVEGDLEDKASLRPIVERVDGIFSVTNFWTQGYDRQVLQGKNIADVAAEVGIEHLIFSGVGDHDKDTGVPHFDSASEIDQHIQELGLANTIFKPVFFYHNLEVSAEDILGGTFAFPLAEGVELQMVDVKDVGRAVAVAFANPEKFIGKSLNLAGDELTLEESAKTISEVAGVEVNAYHVPIDEARELLGEEFTVMCEWFNEVGYSTDIEALEETLGFRPVTFEEYLREHDWREGHTADSVAGWAKAM